MNSASIPEGPGAVSGAPGLPAGFAGTFTSRYIDAGEVRLHAVIGGAGPPLLLVHGWPQTWYAWRLVMPSIARDFEVIAVDQRGVGLSDKPEDGYDTGTQANDMVALMKALGHKRFAMFGTDTGMPIAYAVAADHPDRLERLVVSEAVIAGVTPSPPLLVPGPLNERLWHLAFNRLPRVNEQLVTGREEIFFGAEFSGSAGTRKLPSEVVKYYIDILASDPGRLRGSFGQYRAFDASIAQNQQRKNTLLTLPVLAICAEEGLGQGVIDTMKLVADDLQSVIIPGSGHWIAEQLIEALTPFLAPYRDPRPKSPHSGPQAEEAQIRHLARGGRPRHRPSDPQRCIRQISLNLPVTSSQQGNTDEHAPDRFNFEHNARHPDLEPSQARPPECSVLASHI